MIHLYIVIVKFLQLTAVKSTNTNYSRILHSSLHKFIKIKIQIDV